MKKNSNSILKVLGIILLVVIVLTWVIPAGSYSSGVFTKGTTTPLGLFDILKLPLSTFANFIQFSLVFLLIGGLYGVMNKTGVYSNLVKSVVKKFSKKENKFLIITAISLTVLSSLTGLNLLLFTVVPFFVAVLLTMKYDKKVTLMATVGAILVGSVASTYGFNFNGYLNYYFSLGVNNNIITNLVFLAIATLLLVMYLTKETKKVAQKNDKKEEVKIPLLENNTSSKKGPLPLIIISSIALLLLIVGMYNWKYAFNTSIFEDMYTTIMGVKIGDYAIIQNIFGSINPLGYWNVYEMSIILVVLSLVIGWLYNVKFSDMVDGFISGMKEMVKPAIYVAFANIIFHIIVITQSGSNLFYTITNAIFGLGKGFNAFTMSLFTVVGSVFYNDFTYLVGMMGTNITAIFTDTTVYPMIAIILRSIFGIVSLIIPTSVVLVAGLTYLDIPYKEWAKYIWKFLLEILAVAIVIIIITALI